MKTSLRFLILITVVGLTLPSCVSKKKFTALQTELETCNTELGKCGESLHDYMNRVTACEQEKQTLRSELNTTKRSLELREEQLADLKSQRDKSITHVEDLTSLSKSASDNINQTLAQLEKKDKYIQLLQAAKNRTDSLNLALAVNLKSALSDGIEDEDVSVKIDKTVVFINLSDKMLYSSGSANLTPRAKEVLGKIAQIVENRPDLQVMVEGYTDNVPIKNNCMQDNWDLSVKRATSVVRVLQDQYQIDPNRLIAAGRGEYNTLASNDTAEGRSTNRRTRIIILPKLDQFYDLLNPNLATNNNSTEE